MNTGSSLFMLVGATCFLFFFGLPLFFCPMAWARRIGWKVPEEKDLANYLGRSLGGVTLPVIIMAYRAAHNPWEFRFVFDLVIGIGIFMVIVHTVGLVRKNQPLIEHLEILMYAVVTILAWTFYPQQPVPV